MRIVATSDTHFPFNPAAVPDGDVFVLAGDMMYYGDPGEWEPRLECLAALPHKHKLYVPGNHDYYPRGYRGIANSQLRREAKVTLLDDMNPTIENDRVKFLGLPFVTGLRGWAYNVEENWLYEHVKQHDVPDVVISHSPPYKIRARAGKENFGALAYNKWFYEMEKKPRLWVCGHIHESYGIETIEGCMFANAAMCNEQYEQENYPLVFEIVDN